MQNTIHYSETLLDQKKCKDNAYLSVERFGNADMILTYKNGAHDCRPRQTQKNRIMKTFDIIF